MVKNSSKFGLVKKALYIWIVQYHGIIPLKILKTYIHKFNHESTNIAKYGQRYYDPQNQIEYNKWLSMQTYKSGKKEISMIFVGKDRSFENCNPMKYLSMEKLDISKIDTEYVAVIDGNVQLYPELWNYLDEVESSDITYFDHDLIINGKRLDPYLKPDFSYFFLRQYNYIGPMFIIKKETLKQFDGELINGYKWLLELSDQNLKWNHVSKILYGTDHEEDYDKNTVREYLGNKANIIASNNSKYGYVSYPVQGKPLVSIIIPTKDNKDVLKTCIDSVINRSTYKNYEIVIADNRSENTETLLYFEQMTTAYNNIHVVKADVPFNYSLINNMAVKSSRGEYIVLLNNDTEIITPDWLEKMLSYAQQEKCGSVGVKLYYKDGTIQHGGVITGKGGAMGAHRYYHKPHDEKGYMHTLETANDVICCTAACLMVLRKKYDEIGGFNEELTVQYNDVDFGIRLYEKGYFNVFLPDVELFHYESKSRGIDKKKESVDRYLSEIKYAKEHYGNYVKHDPFYNDQFDKNYDYMLIVGSGSN